MKRSTLLRRASAKEKVTRVKGLKIPPREAGGRAHRRLWREIASRGRSLKKQEEPLKSPRRKAKAKVEERPKAKEKAKCYVCGGIGHPARLCPSEGWVNDLEEDEPEGEDTNEEGCWTEEDDETLQLRYFGSDSCLMSSPPGPSDAFNEAGWTVVTRKSRNRQQGSRRRGCSDKRGMGLGSLRDDDNDIGQVADDRTKKGMVKISAQFSLKVRKDLPRRRERSHSCARREVGDWPNGSGTMPQDRLGSLPSEASPGRCQDHEGWKSSLLGRG